MNPSTEPKTERVTSSVFDLDSFDDVLLVKNVPFEPVKSTQEALAAVGNDAHKFLAIINEGLRQHVRESAKANSDIPWMIEDEEGALSPFSGTIAQSKEVNTLKLTLAKTLYKYGQTGVDKAVAKQKAMNFIKGNDDIREKLKENAASA